MIIPKANLGLYAKLISICATYDALTSKRPFRDAYGPEVALMLMWTEMRNRVRPRALARLHAGDGDSADQGTDQAPAVHHHRPALRAKSHALRNSA